MHYSGDVWSFDDVMMDWVPTVHFDLTQTQDPVWGLVEADKPSFHSPTLDSLSQAVWVIVDDGTPEEKRRYSGLVKASEASSCCVSRRTGMGTYFLRV